MAVRAGKVRWVGGCSRNNQGEGVERVCCHCVTEFVAENYAICLSEGIICSQCKAVRLSFTYPGPHSMYEITVSITAFAKRGLVTSAKSFQIGQVKFKVCQSRGDH